MNTICIKSIRTNIHVDIIHANNGYVKQINRKQFRYIKQLQNGLIMFIFPFRRYSTFDFSCRLL